MFMAPFLVNRRNRVTLKAHVEGSAREGMYICI